MADDDRRFVPPPPPVIRQNNVYTARQNSRKIVLILLALLILLLAVIVGGRVVSERVEAEDEKDLALGDKIIGSWVLYMDNSGVGAYVNLKADGSLELTEGRLGEWMITEHRLVVAEGANYVEFFDANQERWVRFMEIRSETDNQLRLIYLQD